MVHPFATQERALALLLLASLAPAQDVAREVNVDPVIRGYADLCYTTYTATADGAAKLEAAVRAFAERPERATLDAARKAWIAARVAYSRTETFRFCGGPIDDVEPLLNAWPVDEVYIDCVPGLAATGIVHDVAHFPRINEHVLTYANERGGETNVSVGWHAIEFLLWGQDQDPNGPGDRSPDDFVDGKKPHADRRRQYLVATTRLLCRQLGELAAAWAPDADNHRRRFERDPNALRQALTGALVFTAFELGGERLAVAYETKNQEQEHSCFSDTSCSDLVQNKIGLVAVLTGELDGARIAPGLLTAVERADAASAANVRSALAVATSAIAAIPQPFDQAFLGDDTAPGRRAILAAIEALEHVAEALTFAGHALGYELPLRPGN